MLGWANWLGSFRTSCFSDLVSVTVRVTCDVAAKCCFAMTCLAFVVVMSRNFSLQNRWQYHAENLMSSLSFSLMVLKEAVCYSQLYQFGL